MYIVAMLSVTDGVVFLLSLKNVENELFLTKGSESSKILKTVFPNFFKFQMIAPFFLIPKHLHF